MSLNVVIVSITALAMAAPGQSAGSDARTTAKTVIENSNPHSKACYRNALYGSDDFEAVRPCNLALENESLPTRHRAILHVNRGVILYNLGSYEDAVSDFSTALDLKINVIAKVLVNRGLSYEALHAERLARLDYESALAFNPDNAIAKRRLEELKKPVYERSKPPSRINAGNVGAPVAGI